MKKPDLKELLSVAQTAEETPYFIEPTLRSRKQMVSFDSAEDLERFFQPITALAPLLETVSRLEESLQEQKRALDQQTRQIKSLEDRLAASVAERGALWAASRALLAVLEAMQTAIGELETEKFKFSLYDLLQQIHDAIRPDERESFEIEGSGLFQARKGVPDEVSDLEAVIGRLCTEAEQLVGKAGLPPGPGDPFRQSLALLTDIEGRSRERREKAQKFGLKVKVVNKSGPTRKSAGSTGKW